tara:strand:- start:416 stop:775 length:360 start_codon:yes stop_codon:yes gene_type:complete
MKNTKVEIDYDIIQNTTPTTLASMVSRAREIGNEIYNIKGWRFPKDTLFVALRSTPSNLDHNQTDTVWFAITAFGKETVDQNVSRAQVIKSVKGNARSYGGFKRLSKAFDKGTLHKTII